MARLRLLVALLLSALLAGCSAKSIMDRVAPETVQELKTNFDYLRHGQYDPIEAALDPAIDRSTVRANLTAMAAKIPAQEPLSVKTVGAYAQCETRKGCQTRVTLEYEFPGKWVITQMVVHSQNGKSAITSFYVEPESESLEAANRFTLRGRQPVQYVILSAGIVSIAVMLYALVLCIRTPMERRKWLWIILVLLGAGKVGVDWTTGEISYHIFWVTILPAGMGAELYGAWIVTVSVPLGALLFLVLRGRLRKPTASTGPPSNTVLPPFPLNADETAGDGAQ
jgi:hypothetical protein